MKNIALQQSAVTILSLEKELTGFWSRNYWNLKFCPLIENQDIRRFACIRFGRLSQPLDFEFRYASYQRFKNKRWSLNSSNVYAAQIHKISLFLVLKAPRCRTLLERGLDEWALMLMTFLAERDECRPTYRERINGRQELKRTPKNNTCLTVFKAIYREIENAYNPKPILERDVWDLKEMGADINPSLSFRRLNFGGIEQNWLHEAAKKYILWTIATGSPNNCWSRVSIIKKFSRFIASHHPWLHASQINRALMLEFLTDLAAAGLKNGVRASYISRLNSFLERCIIEDWLPIPDKRLIYPEDFPRHGKRMPRFVPEFVMAQLMENIHKLESQYRRMILVLMECGMRISELCALKNDCLSQDAEGSFFLTYYQYKLRRDHTIPINKETAAVIQEQFRENSMKGMVSDYLFTGIRSDAAQQDIFSIKLNKFAVEYDIRDENGHLWRFQPHQFRHTVGTRMINNGVQQIFIQNFLGHKSPEMTSVYAHIHDQTMKQEFQAYLERRGDIIDITGKSYEHSAPQDNVDYQWFKKNVLAQSLPNGYCALPLVQGDCPHANACLTCAHFRTDAGFLDLHREQLKETTRLVQIARDNNWSRQIETNERIKRNLKTIISSLEAEEQTNEQNEK